MGDKPPIVYHKIEEIYGDSEKSIERFTKLKNAFMKKYGETPSFYCRAPGRVNIIGEHIDYCGYGVLPMALEQDIVFAVSTNETTTYKMSNMKSKFCDYETNAKDFQIAGHQWYDYLLCGHKAIIDCGETNSPCGMNVMVDGIVPESAGLSSSSSLVCCSALATMTANGKSLSRLALGEACQKSESYVGTEGGGMDQAISCLAEAGTAKMIDFKPLRTTDVHLPNGVVFVVANCMREMNKSENAGDYYNKRVSECRISAQIISKKNGVDWRKTRRLVDTQNSLNKTLEEMVQQVELLLHKEPYTREDVCKELEISDDELITECLNPSTAQAKEFKLYNRAKHVYSEANRVLQYKEICDSNVEDSVEILGKLMNDSQESCSNDYECSCIELDELTQICRDSGALGSRLTGAGWGGCTVSLVPSGKLTDFVAKVKERYYDPHSSRRDHVSEALFATKPGSGAAVLKLA